MKQTTIVCSVVALAIGLAGGLMASPIMGKIRSARVAWDDSTSKKWPAEFSKAATDAGQPVYMHSAKGDLPRPLVISLHTWSGGFDQQDQLASYAIKNNWNYVHPHVQGANDNPSACLSDAVVKDVNDAYAWAARTMNVDPKNVIIVGASGGAYTALGSMLKSDVPAKAYFAWVPITDLAAWRLQSKTRNQKYMADVAKCAAVDGTYSVAEARARSPQHMPLEEGRRYPNLYLYTGINDGFNGSVPVSHAILFYNKMALHYGADVDSIIDAEQMAAMTTRASLADPEDMIGDRDVYMRKSLPGLSMTVFEGSHEMLVDYTAAAIEKEISS